MTKSIRAHSRLRRSSDAAAGRLDRLAFGVACTVLLAVLSVPALAHAGTSGAVTLQPLPGSAAGSQAWSVNTSGVIVGHSGDQAVRWVPSNGDWSVEALGADGIATGVNEAGQVCIQTIDAQAQIWDNGILVSLPATGPVAVPRGINNFTDVVGTTVLSFNPLEVRGVVWESGSNATAQVLPPLPGGDFSQAFAINDFGEIVGQANRLPNGAGVPVLWVPGGNGQYHVMELANEIQDDDTDEGFARAIGNTGLIGGVGARSRPAAWLADDPTIRLSLTRRGVGPKGTVNGVNDGHELVGFKGTNGKVPKPVYWPSPGTNLTRLLAGNLRGFARDISNRTTNGVAYVVGYSFSDEEPETQAFVKILP